MASYAFNAVFVCVLVLYDVGRVNSFLTTPRSCFHGVSRPVPSIVTARWVVDVEAITIPDNDEVKEETSALHGQVSLPPIGLGAWSWGDVLVWGYNERQDAELEKVFDYAVSMSTNGGALFDTAELYGMGRSETLIGKFAKKYDPERVQVATKFAALPFRLCATDVVRACEASYKRLGNRPIALYQVHFPGAWANAEYWDGLAKAYERGLVKSVGVCNYGAEATRACHKALSERGIQLATNQIQFNLLYRHPLDNGLLQTCEELGVKVLAYSPLAVSMLTGKHSRKSPPTDGYRRLLFERLMSTPDYDNLLGIMNDIANNHEGSGATVPQVALNWCISKNTIPIPGARTIPQVMQNYNTLKWDLSTDEVDALDMASSKVKTFVKPENYPFPPRDLFTQLKLFDS